MLFSKFTISSSAAVNRSYVYTPLENEGYKYRVGIYTDNSGNPDALIAQSPENTSGPAGWQEQAFPETALAAGVYWIGTVAENTGAIEAPDASQTSFYICEGTGWLYFSGGLPASTSSLGSLSSGGNVYETMVYFAHCDY
jgi:hypothetical protein